MAEIKIRELEKGNILAHLIYLSLPLLITNLLQNFLSIFDMFLLGRINVKAQSAISIIGSVFGIYWAMSGGLQAGSTAITSRLCGRKDYDRLRTTIINMIFTGYLMGILFSGTLFFFREAILRYFGAKGATFDLGMQYFSWGLVSLVNDSGLFVFFAILRGTGSIRKHFYLTGAAVILNTILEPVLIFGLLNLPQFGIKGVAFARLGAYFVTTAIMIYILTNDTGVLRIDPKNLKIDLGFLKDYLSISAPAAAQGILPNFAGMILLKLYSGYGDNFIATMGICGRLDVFVMMLGWAIGSSTSVMVGHNLGANQPERAEKSTMTALKFYSIFTFACFMIYFLFSPFVMRIFTSDYSVIEYGSRYLKIMPPVYLLMGVAIITNAAFNGSGSTKTPMVINLIAIYAIQVPLAFILTRIPSIHETGIFIAIASVPFFQGIVQWIFYKKGDWKLKKI